MKQITDKRPKAKPDVRDSFFNLPDVLTPKQDKALKDIRKLLKYELK